jgi:hypothetical protein
LIFDQFLIPNHEEACAVPITHYSASEGDQSLSSASDKSITFSLTTIHVQRMIVEFIKADINVQARAPLTTFPMPHNKKSEYIVASHYSKTFLHFSKDFAIFCEGDWENMNNENNSKDNEVVVRQKLNLPSSALLASVLLAFASLALVHICLVGHMDPISLVGLSGQISAISLDSHNSLGSLVGGIRLDGMIGLVGQTGLLGLVGQIASVGHVGLIGFIRLIGLVGHTGLDNQNNLDDHIGLIGLSNLVDIINLSCINGLVDLIGLGGFNGLVG